MITISFVPVYLLLTVLWVFAAIPRIKSQKTTVLQEIGLWILFAYFLIVIHLTFTPFRLSLIYFNRNATLVPFVETLAMIQYARLSASVYNILGNILLLVPFGFLLPALYPRVQKSLTIFLYSFVLSLFIETLQWAYAVGIFDIDDVIFNTAGGCFGYLLYAIIWKKIFRNKFGHRNNAWTQKSPIKLFLLGLCVFTIITSSAFAFSYFTQTLSADKIRSQIEESGAREILTYKAGGYRYILSKEVNGDLQLELYRAFPMSRYIKVSETNSPANQQGNSSLNILADLIHATLFPRLTGAGREMVEQRAPYAVFGELTESVSEIYAEYSGERFPALVKDSYFLIIIDRKIPLEYIREKVTVKAITADGEILRLGFKK